jgi:hypothetical protein
MGRKTRFWEDVWVGHKPLCVIFSRLYTLSFSHQITIVKIFLRILTTLDLEDLYMVKLWKRGTSYWICVVRPPFQRNLAK